MFSPVELIKFYPCDDGNVRKQERKTVCSSSYLFTITITSKEATREVQKFMQQLSVVVPLFLRIKQLLCIGGY